MFQIQKQGLEVALRGHGIGQPIRPSSQGPCGSPVSRNGGWIRCPLRVLCVLGLSVVTHGHRFSVCVQVGGALYWSVRLPAGYKRSFETLFPIPLRKMPHIFKNEL